MSLTLTARGSTEDGGSTATVSFSSPASGDLLIGVCCAGHGGGAQFSSGPSGWTQRHLDDSSTHNNHSFGIFAKVSDGTETSALFTWNTTKTGSAFVYSVAYDGGALTLSELSEQIASFTNQTSFETGDATVDATNESAVISGIDTAGSDGGWDTAASPWTAGYDLEGPVGNTNSHGCLRTETQVDTDGFTDLTNTIGWTTTRSGFGWMIWVEQPGGAAAASLISKRTMPHALMAT